MPTADTAAPPDEMAKVKEGLMPQGAERGNATKAPERSMTKEEAPERGEFPPGLIKEKLVEFTA